MAEFQQVDILLVEDNPHDAEMTMRVLKKQKLANHVEWVQDGADALDFIFCEGVYQSRANISPPRLILLDIKLPKVNGFEVLKKVKESPLTKTIPIVMLTSSVEDQDLLQCYQLGVNSYIVKPVEFDSFQEEVSRAGFYWMLVNQAPVT